MDTNWLLHTVVVTYNDEITTLDAISKALDKAGFVIEGEPVFLK